VARTGSGPATDRESHWHDAAEPQWLDAAEKEAWTGLISVPRNGSRAGGWVIRSADPYDGRYTLALTDTGFDLPAGGHEFSPLV
jgi:hypothetical protein